MTILNKILCDWLDVKNECRATVNKDGSDIPPTPKFKLALLISEHSPIRLLEFKWRWPSIKSWISVHFARHWLGWDKWISTQRDDRTAVDRNKSPQDTPVNMDVKANAQALINVSRYRLCIGSAHPETRHYMEDLKRQVRLVEPEVAEVMVPNCIYRGGCPEFTKCGFYKQFLEDNPDLDISNISERYARYNVEFYGGYKN